METILLSLGYSPCPNDTYIFEAIANRRVSTGPCTFSPVLADVEILNRRARNHELDITKISFHALIHCLNEYWLIRSGGALGKGCGPIVVTRQNTPIRSLENVSIAIPGQMTSANLLLRLLGERTGPTVEMPFDQIMPAVASAKVDAGLVIHEGRFTYGKHGLRLFMDLGAWWEKRVDLPLPLGCIVVRRRLGQDISRLVETKIRESLMTARNNPQQAWPYIKTHAQEMDDTVIERHIDTFVNDYTFDVGKDGEQAIRAFLQAAADMEGKSLGAEPLFWDE